MISLRQFLCDDVFNLTFEFLNFPTFDQSELEVD